LNGRVYLDLEPMLDACGLSGELQRRGALTVYESEKAFRNDSEEWNFKRRDEARELEPALSPVVTNAVLTPQWLVLTPVDGSGPRALRCLECDQIDPLHLPRTTAWFAGELRPPK
jgi:glycine/D-amino acid oxidase-like deaminating enzyme